jgi:hypothetical protein
VGLKVPTYLLERVVPRALDVRDPDQIALHTRWAADAYQAAGITWLGGVATDKGTMYGLIVAESDSDIDRYCASIGVGKDEFKVRKVIAALGPFTAMPKNDPRYRPLKR